MPLRTFTPFLWTGLSLFGLFLSARVVRISWQDLKAAGADYRRASRFFLRTAVIRAAVFTVLIVTGLLNITKYGQGAIIPLLLTVPALLVYSSYDALKYRETAHARRKR